MAPQLEVETHKGRVRGRTGPRTVAGKKRASGNARRHGLSLSAGKDPDLSPDVERLASAIAGPDEARLAHARVIAEAGFDLRRVRSARLALLDPARAARSAAETGGKIIPATVDPKEMETILEKLPQVLRLDRYERRAMSRRKRALRALRA